ncbi:MAG: hypothetical protein RJB38_2209 [Pseudomonadota bacterium]
MLVFIFLSLAFVRVWSSSFDDFTVYWRAGKEALAGLSVYTEPGHFQFKYSPFVALFLGVIYELIEKALIFVGIPPGGFRHHDLNQGPLIWGSARAVGTLFYWGWLIVWFFWFKRLVRERSPHRDQYTHFALLALLLVHPLAQELGLGQLNAIPILGITFVIHQLDHRPNSWSRRLFQVLSCSIALSLAVQFKLFSLILFPLLAFRRRWSWILGSLAVTAACLEGGLSLAHNHAHALHEVQAWGTSLTRSSSALMVSRFNVSWWGFIAKATGSLLLAQASWVALVVSFLVIQWRNRFASGQFQLSFLLAAILILNPLVWNYWLIFLAPLILDLLAQHEQRLRQHSRLAVLLGIVIWIPFLLMFALVAQNWLQPILIFGITVFWLFSTKPLAVALPRNSGSL